MPERDCTPTTGCTLALLAAAFMWVSAACAPATEAVTRTPATDSMDAAAADRRELNAKLLHSAGSGDVAAVEELLGAGVPPNARDENRRTALMLVTTMGHEVTERIIQEGLGARVEIVGLPAPPVTDSQLAVIELLIRRGADVEASDSAGKTALMLAVERDYARIAARLLEAGADPDTRFASGLPLVCLAANRGFVRTLKILIEGGASLDASSATGKQALHYAVEANHAAVVRLLLDRDVPVDVPTAGDWTALHIAASLGYRQLVELLLDRGADRTRLTAQKMTPEQVARARGHNETAELLTP